MKSYKFGLILIFLIFSSQNDIACKSIIAVENLENNLDLNSQPWGFHLYKEGKFKKSDKTKLDLAAMFDDEEKLKYIQIKELPFEFDVNGYKYFDGVLHILTDDGWYSPVILPHALENNKKYLIGYSDQECPVNAKTISKFKTGNICLLEQDLKS